MNRSQQAARVPHQATHGVTPYQALFPFRHFVRSVIHFLELTPPKIPVNLPAVSSVRPSRGAQVRCQWHSLFSRGFYDKLELTRVQPNLNLPVSKLFHAADAARRVRASQFHFDALPFCRIGIPIGNSTEQARSVKSVAIATR